MGPVGKRIFITLGIGGVITAIYLLWKKTAKLQNTQNPSLGQVVNTAGSVLTGVVTGNTITKTTDPNYVQPGFPLKKGSQGALVKTLQQALANNFGGVKKVLPKYGIDGDFGSETETALKNAFNGMTQVKDQATLDSIVNYSGGGTPMVYAPSAYETPANAALANLGLLGLN